MGIAETAGAGGSPVVWLGAVGSAHQKGEEGEQGEEHQEGGETASIWTVGSAMGCRGWWAHGPGFNAATAIEGMAGRGGGWGARS